MGKSKGMRGRSHRADFHAEDEQPDGEWDSVPPPEHADELADTEEGPLKPVLFWKETQNNGYLSNWYLCNFKVDGVQYTSSEQFYMHQKALTFGDFGTAAAILADTNPKRIKQLGREVQGFKPGKWKNRCRQVMEHALEAKFSQNPELSERLLKTYPKRIAEASPSDSFWGIGLAPSNKLAQDPSKWKRTGENALGELLEALRERLLNPERTLSDAGEGGVDSMVDSLEEGQAADADERVESSSEDEAAQPG
mmetsp:Transcript_50276/g.92916  ORF Transcript_50276/g.92916 Transcript_50276/m.92916 type:complete len:252 (-) Transcript_50276:181-936(-)